MRRTSRIGSGLVVLALAGCGDDMASSEPTVAETDGGTTGAEDPTEGLSGGVPTTGEPFEPVPARGGIRINRVEANPGVAVAISIDGVPVPGPDRNAYLPNSRDTLLRVYVDVPDDWVERPIEARLRLSGGDVEEVLTQTLTISADTADGALDSGFYFGLLAKNVVPGLRYSVELWESEPGQEDLPEPEQPAIDPPSGLGFIGIESAPTDLRLVFVPIDYSFGACSALVDGEAERPAFEKGLLQQNPTANLEFVVREPHVVNYDLTTYTGLSKLVSEMSQLRTSDGVDANVYYYGLFDNCGRCIGSGGGNSGGCTVGLAANITGDSVADARWRASVGQLRGGAVETFVHEVGHTQGRRHIKCAGAGTQAAGTDPSYPHADGKIGVWGFGIRDSRLRHPTTHADYMSYCSITWVSDWQWNATYERIVKLTSWDYEHTTPATGGSLIGAVDPDGQQIWWTDPHGLGTDAISATHSVVFEFADGEVEALAQVGVREDYPTRNIVAALPEGFDDRTLLGIRLRDEQGEHPVPATQIRLMHHPDAITATP